MAFTVLDSAELERTIAADLDRDDVTRRSSGWPITATQLMLRYDPTHELPHVVETPQGKVIARFELLGDLAYFVCPVQGRHTLPARYVERVPLEARR